MTKNNRFAVGSGCYTCRICGKRTRKVDDTSEALEMCATCYEICTIENQILDDEISEAEGLKQIADIKRKAKGA